MGRKIHPFGTSAVDALVKDFLQRKGIEPKDITGYRLTRSLDDIGTIRIDMIFEDQAAEPESDKAPEEGGQ